MLEFYENKMLENLKIPYDVSQVETTGGFRINTLESKNTPRNAHKPPLVLIHGFGGGIGLWVKNLEYLAEHHKVYALDVVGETVGSCVWIFFV
jgi:abhydrolase domain-containing protein 5